MHFAFLWGASASMEDKRYMWVVLLLNIWNPPGKVHHFGLYLCSTWCNVGPFLLGLAGTCGQAEGHRVNYTHAWMHEEKYFLEIKVKKNKFWKTVSWGSIFASKPFRTNWKKKQSKASIWMKKINCPNKYSVCMNCSNLGLPYRTKQTY